MATSHDFLRLHIETLHSVAVDDLSSSLMAYGRQYQDFAVKEGLVGRPADARLLVSSVSEGSIDISFIPELAAVGMTLLPLVDQGTLVLKFADQLLTLLKHFRDHSPNAPDMSVNTSDCDDVANIVGPVADNGGTQTITVINGGVTVNHLTVSQSDAKRIRRSAHAQRAELTMPSIETRRGVPLTWHQLAKDAPKTQGKRSPDQGVIEEIDDGPHAVLFTDDTAHLKGELIGDGENPYRMIYFVDVEVSRVSSKVVSYRVFGFHGKQRACRLAVPAPYLPVIVRCRRRIWPGPRRTWPMWMEAPWRLTGAACSMAKRMALATVRKRRGPWASAVAWSLPRNRSPEAESRLADIGGSFLPGSMSPWPGLFYRLAVWRGRSSAALPKARLLDCNGLDAAR